MKGKNTLRLNEQTMLAAVQLWLNGTFKGDAPQVIAIRQIAASTPYGGSEPTPMCFDIDVASELPEEPLDKYRAKVEEKYA